MNKYDYCRDQVAMSVIVLTHIGRELSGLNCFVLCSFYTTIIPVTQCHAALCDLALFVNHRT